MEKAQAVQAVVENAAEALIQKGLPAVVHGAVMSGRPWGWITPDSHWPNYRQAKIGAGITSAGKLWVGIRWDKGLMPQARGYIAERPMLMTDEGGWAWSELMGRIDQLQEAMAETQGPSPLVVQLSFGNGVVPGFRPFLAMPKHTIVWRHQGGRLELDEPVYDIGAVQQVKEARSLAQAFDLLAKHTDWGWTWVTLSLGWHHRLVADASGAAHLGRDVLIGGLEPLLPFYVPSLKEVVPNAQG